MVAAEGLSIDDIIGNLEFVEGIDYWSSELLAKRRNEEDVSDQEWRGEYDDVQSHAKTKLSTFYDFSEQSMALLEDKGLQLAEYAFLFEAMELDEETFAERRDNTPKLEVMLNQLDSIEITSGRYRRYVKAFHDISSEQALIKGRMKFTIEYVISLADEIAGEESKIKDSPLVERPFTGEEKASLRGIYENFSTSDALAVQAIERKTKHDAVAANTWVTIRADQKGIDFDLMRRITHFARTTSDINTNVTGELYMKALGSWSEGLSKLVGVLEERAREYATLVCVGKTHGQNAQLTTLGHIYANLAEQIKLHAKPLLGTEPLVLDGKIAGAIGTDVDMKAAFPNHDFREMYRHIVESKFGLNYVKLGNDQDCSNAELSRMLDCMVNVGMVVEKAAVDTWLYASRDILGKVTTKGESGSSAMPQKANPFLAEGCEALMEIMEGMVGPIKRMIVPYREQGDLRRSITKREGYHPIMLSAIAMGRLVDEIKKYEPNVIGIEHGVHDSGAKVISSAINTYLRAQGVPDAYDTIKKIVMKHHVSGYSVSQYVDGMLENHEITEDVALELNGMLQSVLGAEDVLSKIQNAFDGEIPRLIDQLKEENGNPARRKLLGTAVEDTYEMADNAQRTQGSLLRYVA